MSDLLQLARPGPGPDRPPAHPPTRPAGIAKHGRGHATDDIATAVELLFTRNLEQSLPGPARVVPNTFRSERLYNEDVRGASQGLLGLALP
jgi:hypothetical protein